jgi:hypothetical protein
MNPAGRQKGWVSFPSSHLPGIQIQEFPMWTVKAVLIHIHQLLHRFDFSFLANLTAVIVLWPGLVPQPCVCELKPKTLRPWQPCLPLRCPDLLV